MAFDFFNFQKEGKGIERDEYTPRFTLYFKLFFRKLGLMTKANFVYLLTNILVLIISFIGYFNFSSQGDIGFAKGVIFLALVTIYMSVAGIGFLMPGITYVTRNFAKQRHVWVFSDFFQHMASNFKKGIVIFLLDTAVFVLGYIAISVYSNLMEQNILMLIPMAVTEGVILIYFMMHFYIHPIMVTFDLSLKNIFKNSLILTIVHLPWNLLIMLVVILISFSAFMIFPYIGIIVMLVFGVAFLNFTVNYMVDPIIDRHLYIPAKIMEENNSAEKSVDE